MRLLVNRIMTIPTAPGRTEDEDEDEDEMVGVMLVVVMLSSSCSCSVCKLASTAGNCTASLSSLMFMLLWPLLFSSSLSSVVEGPQEEEEWEWELG